MSALKGLNFTAMPQRAGLTPVQQRRAKLVGRLREQKEIAAADAESRTYAISKRRWQKSEDGSKQLVDVPKRLKRWWTQNADGTIALCVRWGSKPMAFEKGKDAIAIGVIANLPVVLDKLIAAADAGELDAMIAAANAARTPSKLKASKKAA